MRNVQLIAVGSRGDLRLRATLEDGSSWTSDQKIRRNPPYRLQELERLCRSESWPLASREKMEEAFKAFRAKMPNVAHITKGKRNSTKGKMHTAMQNGKCWYGTLDLAELKHTGFVVIHGFLKIKRGELVTALHAPEATSQPWLRSHPSPTPLHTRTD